MTAGPTGIEATRPALMRPVRYIPLALLTAIAVVLAVVGFVREGAESAPSAAVDRAPVTGFADVGDGCFPDVEPPAEQPWADDPARAEEVWAAHADALSGPYVQGESGFVFWGDVQALNLSQAVGRRSLSSTEVERWSAYLRGLEQELSSRGVELVVAIAPAKWDVYPELLPEWMRAIRGSGPLDQLRSVEPGLPIVDLRGALREAARSDAVYSAVNSHWSDYGGYVGWRTIIECARALHPGAELPEVPAVERIASVEASNEFATYGVPTPAADWTLPILETPPAPVRVTRETGEVLETDGTGGTDLSLLPVVTENAAAPDSGSLLLLRDSMGNAISTFAQQAFRETVQVRHSLDAPELMPDVTELVDEHEPSIVVLEIAERFLQFAPPEGAS